MDKDIIQAKKDFPFEVIERVDTPCYLISEDVIKRNCEILDFVQVKTGANILLAQKAYALPVTYPLISKYLKGVCASGLWEARLGYEEFGGEVHTYSPVYKDDEIDEIIYYSDKIIFNSIDQFKKYANKVKLAGKLTGIRVNPGYSEVDIELYNPCAPGSRFGVNSDDLESVDFDMIDGLHFHALCEQNADVFERVLNSFEKKFGKFLKNVRWVNFGGGHHITKWDYDVDLLINLLNDFKERYPHLEIYLEPGEAVVLNAGVFVTTVVDIIKNEIDIAVVDSSAETHTPDVLAMPYTPKIIGADKWEKYPYKYRIGGCSCLAGDFFGNYSFEEPLKEGDRLIMLDMALYSFVKNTVFNGVRLPDITVFNKEKGIIWNKKYDYTFFKSKYQ